MHLIICGNKLNKMIPTAEEFLDKKYGVFTDDRTGEKFADCVTPNDLIEFAKFHVEEALKEAAKSAYARESRIGYVWEVNEESILNAYPLENIK